MFIGPSIVVATLLSFADPALAGGFILSAAELDTVTAGQVATIGDSDAFASATGMNNVTQVVTDVSVGETEARAFGDALGVGEQGSSADAFSVVGSGGGELSQNVGAASVATSEGAIVSGALTDVALKTDGAAGSIGGVAVSFGDVGFTEATASLAKVTDSGQAASVAAGDALGSTGQPTVSQVSGTLDSQFDMTIGASASGDDVSNAESAIGGTIAMSAGTFSPSAGSAVSATGEGSSADSMSFLRVLERKGITAMFVGSVARGSGGVVDKISESAIAVSGTAPDARVISRTFESDRGNGTRSVTVAIVLPQSSLAALAANRNVGGFSRLRGS